MININDNHKKFDFAIKILEDEFKSRELIFKVKTRRSNFDISKFVYPVPASEVNAGFGVLQTTGWDANLPK